MPWGFLSLLLIPVLLVASLVLLVVRCRSMTSRLLLLLLASVAAGVWTFATMGRPVMVSNPEDPQGSECIAGSFERPNDLTVSWDSDCGQALARHLLVSGGPTLVLLGITVTATVQGVRRRWDLRKRPSAPAPQPASGPRDSAD